MNSDKLKISLFSRGFLVFVGIALLFLILRIPAIRSPYHQDEYKWVYYSHEEKGEGTVPHPPLTEFIYAKTLGPLLGDDNFRFIPLGFSLANLVLVFYLAKVIFDKKTAFWSAFIFSVSFFSVLASVMVDVDGAVMPFFLLMLSIGYFKLREAGFKIDKSNLKWLLLVLIGAVGGFLIKMSGVLPLAAFAFDFALIHGLFEDKKKFFKFIGLGALLMVFVAIVILFSKLIFPYFPVEKSLEYWSHFINSSSFLGRGWFQTLIQLAKSVLYASPLLVIPIFFIDREIWKRIRPFFLFLIFAFVFYIIAFDFSLGALDRYFQFLVVPLSIIAGAVLSERVGGRNWKEVIFATLFSALIFSLQFINHFVPSLHPKTEWISRIISLKWNFLYPFSGGSGPLPFYVSFLFIALIWLVSIFVAVFALKFKNLKKAALTFILILGFVYNGIFIEEYLFGKINGSSKNLVKETAVFINSNPEIKKVIVYNDNGGYEIQKTGKYERRLYATPQFENSYKEILGKYKGSILYIDIPKIGENTFYSNYLNSCEKVFEERDKYITSRVLDCSK